ncbi:MAG: efflux RND transporter periplasmic adaptor subunit [Proteobacteria bacterium]|nr:efflux RND transporter periplasmic adaptor subunit [Pseudomonadota bacterium]
MIAPKLPHKIHKKIHKKIQAMIKKGAAIGSDRMLKIGLPILIVVLALVVVGVLKATKPEVKARPVAEKQWPVAVVEAKIEDIPPKRLFYGEIVAGREAELRTEVQGRVVSVAKNFIDGGIVAKGDLLLEIDPFEYTAQLSEREAELTEAKARWVELEADLEGSVALLVRDKEQSVFRQRDVARRVRLMRQKNVSEKAFDDAKLALSEARQRIIEREQNIKKLQANIDSQRATIQRRAVAVDRAKRDLEDTKLHAPAAGFLTAVGTAVGRYVSVGDTVAKLIQADRLEVKFQVGNRQFGRLVDDGGFAGRKADIVWRGGGEKAFSATIARVGSVVDAATGGINLYARIEGLTTKTRLRPGVFVEVGLLDKLYKGVIRLPETALHEDTVYTVVNDRSQAQRVTVEARVGNEILVRGSISAGDKVIITDFNEIGPGIRVTVR